MIVGGLVPGTMEVPLHTELSTQEAADLLGVSRPFLVKELQSGKIPFRRIGTHRRIILKNLLAYTVAIQQQRSKALDQLVEQAQEINMGYSDV